MVRKNVHVQLNNDGKGWDVVREGNKRPTQSFTTQRDAMVLARTLARDARTTLYVHNRNGNVRRITSYSVKTRTKVMPRVEETTS